MEEASGVVLPDGILSGQEITYGGVSAGTVAVAAGLRRGGLGPGEAAVLITVPEARLLGRVLRFQVPSLRQVVTTGELQAGAGGSGALPAVAADDTALLQYTPGSTGDPKGVMLAHRHLLASIRAMGSAADAGPADLFVSWLPLYHDMGLIGAWLAGLYYGFPLAVMSPLAFPVPASPVAARDQRTARHPVRGTELRVRTVPAADSRPGAGRRRPVGVAAGIRRLRSGQPGHAQPVR